ncbi:2,3-diaminopropionate biosynthesis protein SbnA [Moorena producens PAL-8-15-08-1]|uniref:N-(2-amino-2-carboxyethyl)-L-glutamate synthase n=1 Tax=Moorena producens PAL-8-15-08-1 TaxID=1458985 RepID=A0A1D8TZK1_9CYAN|nr:2,3-diaminopropionate biosynthesis protein SbnA [Moorena producens]AOX03079.1 2,3-diaminopropionate biosynthesis protein SbnA [Moorena producens PAL-8-15-08-1]
MGLGIISAIGKTPLIQLSKFWEDSKFNIFAKLEFLNPGGSIKDRPALNIIHCGLETGQIDSNTVVIESSSGNMAIGLAQACSYFNLSFICVVDSKTTTQNLQLLKLYGAKIDIIEQPDPVTGEFLQARLNRVKTLCNLIPNSFWPNQYGNYLNPEVHHQTMDEIVRDLGEQVDYLFVATSTCGTIRGCGEYCRTHNLKTKVIAVDALGSKISGNEQAERLIPGLGAGIKPEHCKAELIDKFVQVSSLDCVVGCRHLARTETILAGGSAGGIAMAIAKMYSEIPAGSNCVAILPDRGERYLDTVYSDTWVRDKFGEVDNLWKQPIKVLHSNSLVMSSS